MGNHPGCPVLYAMGSQVGVVFYIIVSNRSLRAYVGCVSVDLNLIWGLFPGFSGFPPSPKSTPTQLHLAAVLPCSRIVSGQPLEAHFTCTRPNSCRAALILKALIYRSGQLSTLKRQLVCGSAAHFKLSNGRASNAFRKGHNACLQQP